MALAKEETPVELGELGATEGDIGSTVFDPIRLDAETDIFAFDVKDTAVGRDPRTPELGIGVLPG